MQLLHKTFDLTTNGKNSPKAMCRLCINPTTLLILNGGRALFFYNYTRGRYAVGYNMDNTSLSLGFHSKVRVIPNRSSLKVPY